MQRDKTNYLRKQRRLFEELRQKGVSNREIAAELDVSLSYINNVVTCNGTHYLSGDKMEELIDKFELTSQLKYDARKFGYILYKEPEEVEGYNDLVKSHGNVLVSTGQNIKTIGILIDELKNKGCLGLEKKNKAMEQVDNAIKELLKLKKTIDLMPEGRCSYE